MSDQPENKKPFLPPAFEQTIQRSQSMDVGASIMPEDKHCATLKPTDTVHIPIESLAHKGKQMHFDDTGEMEMGEAFEHPSYDVEKVLGRGGMGVVCAARQKSLGRNLAIKVARKISSDSAATTQAELEQFANEAVITARLDHPNVVPVHALAKDDRGRLFFTMKQVAGISWEELLNPERVRNRAERSKVEARSKAMSLEDQLNILLSVADAVAYGHEKGFIHRDLKPENIMLGSFGEVLVMDWGLAMAFGDQNPYKLDPSRKAQLVGTPAYLAPEMALGHMTEFGPTTDIYLLGGILYRLLTGQPPHTGESVMAAVQHAARGEIDPPEKISPDPRITSEVSRIVCKALAAKQEDRYQQVKDFQAELRQYMGHAESLAITANAKDRLDLLKETWTISVGDETQLHSIGNRQAAKAYSQLSECMGGLRQALSLWPENEEAVRTLLSATSFQIQLALDQGDLTLARSYLEMFENQKKLSEDAKEGARWQRRRKRFRKELEKQQGAQDEVIRREQRHRRVFRGVVLLLLTVGLAVSMLVLQQRTLALENLQLAESQREMARKSQQDTENMQQRMLSQAVAARAELLDLHLQSIEQALMQYRNQAERMLGIKAHRLPFANRTAAGRDGFYLDEDYQQATMRPANMRPDPRYGYDVSLEHAVVKLAPWAQQQQARHHALKEAARVARLGYLAAHMLRTNEDVLYIVFGTESGALISFPGAGRFKNKPEYDPTKRPWYLQAASQGKNITIWTDPHIDSGGRGLLLTCATTIHVDQTMRGVVGIEMSMQKLQRTVSEFTGSTGGSARGLLLRDDGRIILDTHQSFDPARWKDGFNLQRIDDLIPVLSSFVAGARKGVISAKRAIEIQSADGPRLVAFAKLPHLNWMLVVVIDRNAVIHTKP
ncbi:MAG: protein kinase [Deltaproteobacteria bacterium]|nr:protein kinase [Deltaproteobacteria bacterium]